MATIAKHYLSAADNPNFRFGESVKVGARNGTYISRMGAQVYVEFDNHEMKTVPMGHVQSTGVLNEAFIERFASAAEHKAKGGVRTGSRRLIHNPAEKTLRRQYVRAKLLKKGLEPKSASDEPLHKPGDKKEASNA